VFGTQGVLEGKTCFKMVNCTGCPCRKVSHLRSFARSPRNFLRWFRLCAAT
jgi:hypothetical protein